MSIPDLGAGADLSSYGGIDSLWASLGCTTPPN